MHANLGANVLSSYPADLLSLLKSYFIPPKQGAPKSTANSATRTGRSCGPQEARIEAIAPPGGYGLTLRDRPAITLALPPTSAQQVVLMFHNEAKTFVESARLPIPPASRLAAETSPDPSPLTWVSFQLPETAPALPPGRYRWSLVVVCGAAIEPDDPTFMGWIERSVVPAEMSPQPETMFPLEQAHWYGQNGYWYDMIQSVKNEHQTQASNTGIKHGHQI
jgi:hypothetical protein